MKKHFFLIISLAVIILSACVKDPIDPLPPNPIASITTNPAQDIIVNKNESLKISWKAENLTSFSVKLNDEVISTNLNDSIVLDSLKSDQLFIFSGISSTGLNKRKEIKVEVYEIPLPGLTVEIDPDTIFPLSGGCAFIHWVTTNTDSVYINGVSKELTGYMLTPWFYENDYILQFHLVGPSGVKDSTFTLVIEKPTGDEAILVNAKHWVEVYSDISFTSSTGPWQPTGIDYTQPCLADDYWKFKVSPKHDLIYSQNTLCQGGTFGDSHYDWILINDTMHFGGYGSGEYITISFLSTDSLIWVDEGVNITPEGTTPMWMKVKLLPVYD